MLATVGHGEAAKAHGENSVLITESRQTSDLLELRWNHSWQWFLREIKYLPYLLK